MRTVTHKIHDVSVTPNSRGLCRIAYEVPETWKEIQQMFSEEHAVRLIRAGLANAITAQLHKITEPKPDSSWLAQEEAGFGIKGMDTPFDPVNYPISEVVNEEKEK